MTRRGIRHRAGLRKKPRLVFNLITAAPPPAQPTSDATDTAKRPTCPATPSATPAPHTTSALPTLYLHSPQLYMSDHHDEIMQEFEPQIKALVSTPVVK